MPADNKFKPGYLAERKKAIAKKKLLAREKQQKEQKLSQNQAPRVTEASLVPVTDDEILGEYSPMSVESEDDNELLQKFPKLNINEPDMSNSTPQPAGPDAFQLTLESSYNKKRIRDKLQRLYAEDKRWKAGASVTARAVASARLTALELYYRYVFVQKMIKEQEALKKIQEVRNVWHTIRTGQFPDIWGEFTDGIFTTLQTGGHSEPTTAWQDYLKQETFTDLPPLVATSVSGDNDFKLILLPDQVTIQLGNMGIGKLAD